MKFHANAALSWSGRRLLAERVLVEGWTVTATAEAAGVGVRCVRKWVAASASRATRVCSIVRRLPPGRQPHSERAGRGDRAVAAAADDGRRDRRDVGDAALDRFGGTDASGLGRLAAGSARAGKSLREAASGRARPHRREEARPDRRAGSAPRQRDRRSTRTARISAGNTSTSRSTTRADSSMSRCSKTSGLPPRSASSAARSRSSPLRIHVERLMTDNGNAYRSAIHALACKALGIKHLRTRPYRPAPTGKPVYQGWGAVRLDGVAACSRRFDSGIRHVEDAL